MNLNFFSRKREAVIYRGRQRTRDDAFKFRMGAGFPGDVNRTHPAGIEPCLASVNSAPTAFGQGVIVDSGDTNKGVRPLAAGDSSLTAIYGITVRPFPVQAPTAAQNFGGTQSEGGAITPGGTPLPGAIDVLRSGYILVKVNTGSSAPVKGGSAYIRVAATSGNHIQNQFETAADSTNVIVLTGAGSVGTFQSGVDANGVAELAFNV